MSDYLERTKNGTVFTGSDMDIFKGFVLAGSLDLYDKTKMLPTRGAKASGMLKLATEMTGKPYKRGQYAQAAADLREMAEAAKYQPKKEDCP